MAWWDRYNKSPQTDNQANSWWNKYGTEEQAVSLRDARIKQIQALTPPSSPTPVEPIKSPFKEKVGAFVSSVGQKVKDVASKSFSGEDLGTSLLEPILFDKTTKLRNEYSKENPRQDVLDSLSKDVSEIEKALASPSKGQRLLLANQYISQRRGEKARATLVELAKNAIESLGSIVEMDFQKRRDFVTHQESLILQGFKDMNVPPQEQEKLLRKFSPRYDKGAGLLNEDNLNKREQLYQENLNATEPKVRQAMEQYIQDNSPVNPDFADQLTGGITSMAGFYLATLLTGGGAVIPTVLESLGESGAVYSENKKNGMSPSEAFVGSSKTFVSNLVFNALLNKFSGLFENIGEPAVKELKEKVVKTVQASTFEGIQEAGQQLISNINTGKEDVWDGVFESLGLGALIGGGAMGVRVTSGVETQAESAPQEPANTTSTEVTGVPESKDLEQIPTVDELMTEKGWVGGDAQKAKFDTALYTKDAKVVGEMLSEVPEYYREKFSKEIEEILGTTKTEQEQMKELEEQMRAETNESFNVFNEPEVEQYMDVINRAIRVYNLNKSKGNDDFSTITKKVEGFDEALQALRDAGANVSTMAELVQLKKGEKLSFPKVVQEKKGKQKPRFYHASGKEGLSISPDGIYLSPLTEDGKNYSRAYSLKGGGAFGAVKTVEVDGDLNTFDFSNEAHRKLLKEAVSEQEFESYENASRGGQMDWSSAPDSELLQELGFDSVLLFERPAGMDVFGEDGKLTKLKGDVVSMLVFDGSRVREVVEKSTINTVAKDTSVERDTSKVARTPEQLKSMIDNLNKYGQAHAILRRTGGVKGGKGAVGEFASNKEPTGPLPKAGEVRLKGSYIADDVKYISVLAHELGHATEYHLTGTIDAKTLDVFGENLNRDQRREILNELEEVTIQLEGASVVNSKPEYYFAHTELLARFFEMYITNPELLATTAPKALEAIETQSIKNPMLREFMEIVDENMSKKDKPQKTFLPDLRQTYQRALGSKRVGNIAYYEEVTHRALVERAKKVLPDFIDSKFKNVKDSPELLFRVAESIKVTKNDMPEFGTRDFVTLPTEKRSSPQAQKIIDSGFVYASTEVKDGVDMDTYAKSRYTPEQAKELYNKLSPEGQQLIKDFTAQRSEAKDYFNREVIKDVNNINSTLEGWVHHFWDESSKPTMGKSLKFKNKKAGASMQRTGNEGYLMDLKKATTKALVDLETAKVFNDFVERQFARVTKPIQEGKDPDKGWVEVMGNLKKGVGLEGDNRTTIIKDGKAFKAKQTRYQMPRDVYERYQAYRGLVDEASTVSKTLQRLNSYWAINILTDAGTAGTNFIGGGIQYSSKVLTDFYSETLKGDLTYKQTRQDLTAMLKVLLPKGWYNAPDWVYGADLSNWYGQFSQKNISKADTALDRFADKNLKLFGAYERYWKKVISTAENVSDLKSLEEVTKEGLQLPSKEERELIAQLNREVDLFAYDYDNIPMWLTKMKKNPVSAGVKPFATYPYKYAKQITGMVESAFDPSLAWQDRMAKVMALSTLMALYGAFSLERKKRQQTPEATSPDIEIRAKSAGNLFTGVTDEEGNELFIRVSKYPFFGLTEAGIQAMSGNSDSASNVLKEMLGSIGFIGKTALNAFGYRDQYEKYDPTEVVMGKNLSSLVPYTRILDEISRGLDPYKRKQTTFGQTFTRLVPTTSEDLQEKLHGEKRTVTIPLEGSVERTSGTPYSRTTTDRDLKNYWQDILLSSLTGIYIKRVNPEDVEAQIIRDEKNKKKRELEEEKKTLKGSK